MKRLSLVAIVIGGLVFCSSGKANITGVSFQDDGDGAITCPLYTWSGSINDLNVPLDGIQNRGGAAQILGAIQTDTTGDPSLTLNSTINNDTSFAWSAYYVNVYMNTTFTIPAANVSVPSGWTANVIQTPIYVGSSLGDYEGQIEFAMGSGMPVAVNGELDFSYTISFGGATSYTFTQEMIPVPEPGTLGFLGAGMLLLAGLLVTNRRKRHS